MTGAVVFAFVFAWFKGYKWKVLNMFKHWSVYPIILTCFLHIYFVYLVIHNEYWFLEYANYIKIASLLLYFILILKYKLLDISIFRSISLKKDSQIFIWLTSPVTIGGVCVIVGSILNHIVMFYNGNRMPVFISNSFSTGYAKQDIFIKALKYGDFHILGNEFTKLIPLCDTWDFGYGVMSIGDILIRLFVVLIIYYSIIQSNKPKIIIDKQL